jgi:hypothetical protein
VTATRALSLRGTGETIPLESDEFAALNGGAGFGLTARSLRWRDGAGHGSVYRGARALRRSIPLPVLVRGRDADEVLERLDRLSVLMDPDNPLPELCLEIGPDVWSTHVALESGGDWVWGQDTNGSSWVQTTLNLESGDPRWTRQRAEQRDVVPSSGRGLLRRPVTVSEPTNGTVYPDAFGAAPFGAAPFGGGAASGGTVVGRASLTALRVSGAQAMGTVVMDNAGTARADLLTIIQGPAEAVDLIGPTGEALLWRGSLGAGQSRVLDHKARTVVDPSVADPIAANRYDELEPRPLFWDLPPGHQEAAVTLTGAGAGSRVTLTWRPRRWLVF